MRALGIILAGGNRENLGELTSLRATPAMPVGSCYRALDFTLSNMSSSGIGKVAVITQYNSRSLIDHLSSAKWWDLGRKQGGLFIFTPYMSGESSAWFRGTADSIYQNISFLERSNEQYVVIAQGNCIYKMDYSSVIKYHVEKEADITIVYREADPGADLRSYGILELDNSGRVTEFEEKPLEPTSNLISAGIYDISRTLLIKLLENVVPEGRYELVADIFVRYRKRLGVYGYKFQDYWKPLNSIQAYYDCNMDFLNPDVRKIFTKQYPYVETKPKDEPPAKFNLGADVRDALIGGGSILNGHVSHSVIFRNVFTGENTSVRNSIIMEGSYISNNCVVENAILDKEVVLSDGKKVIGEPGNPKIIAKGMVI
jgi:glucose-1-phosphate adenylyltransferase